LTGEKIRYHPSVILENFVQVAWIFLLMLLFSGGLWNIYALLGISAVLVIAFTLLYLRWRKTTVQFLENEMVVERATVFAAKRTIPYSKIASVNVNRGIVNRLFGTTKLLVNVNSSSNAVTPEASLVFKTDLAERIKNHLSQNMYRGEVPVAETDAVSAVSIGPDDVLIHGLFSQSTAQTLVGFFFLGVSIFQLYGETLSAGAIGKAMTTLLLFFITTFLPMISLIFNYARFKVYRVKDTIHIEHGLIATYRTSFEVSRINAVRVRSTVVSRLLGRSYIEAEVIGLSSGKDSKRPVLCLLKKNDTIEQALRELVPEFVYERDVIKQPVTTRKLLGVKAFAISIITFSILGLAAWGVVLAGADVELTSIACLAIGAVIAAAIAIWTIRSYKVKELSVSDKLFTFVNGVADRCMTTMSYDKVQIATVSKGPIARHFDLAVGSVALLSSVGGVVVSSGYYEEAQLNRISEKVMEQAGR